MVIQRKEEKKNEIDYLRSMRNLIIILCLVLSSCGGKGGEKDIIVNLIDKQGTELWYGKLFITYNTKKSEPKRISDEVMIIYGSATFEGLKPGNYTVTFDDETEEWCARYIAKCSYNLRLDSEDAYITLVEGEFK